MAATKITITVNTKTSDELAVLRAETEALRQAEPNNPAAYPSSYDYKALQDCEMAARYLPNDPIQIAAVVARFEDRLPGLAIEIVEGLYAGQVIEEFYEVERIMSDVWDNVYYVRLWIDGAVKTVPTSGWVRQDTGNVDGKWTITNHYLPGLERNDAWDYTDTGKKESVQVRWLADISPETKEQVAAYYAEQARLDALRGAARSLVESVDKVIEQAHQVKQIESCRVVKGRKAPRGDGYQVTYVNHNGQFGPYAHLLSRDGKKYQYISLSNLEATPDWGKQFGSFVLPPVYYGQGSKDTFEVDSALCGLLRNLGETGDKSLWLIIADRVEEMAGHEYAGFLRERISRRVEVASS